MARAAGEVPADRGFTQLGLLMQLGGVVFAAATVIATVALLTSFHRDRHPAMWILVLGVPALARSWVHYAAGVRMTSANAAGQRDASNPALRAYFVLAGCQSVSAAVVAHQVFGCDLARASILLAALASWPAAIALARHRAGALVRDLPLPEDRGIEAAGIAMVVLSGVGAALGVRLLVGVWSLPIDELQQGPIVLAQLAIAAMIARSGLQFSSGLIAMRETSIERTVAAARRYGQFGMIQGLCTGSLLVVVIFLHSLDTFLVPIVFAIGVTVILLAWPLIIRRFFVERQLDELLAAGEVAVFRRAPDLGRTGFAWLMIASAVLTAIRAAVALVADADAWWQLVAAVVGGGAGCYLLALRPRASIVAAVALVAMAIVAYCMPPAGTVGYWSNSHGPDRELVGSLLDQAWLYLQLALAVIAVALAVRTSTPTARARYRTPSASAQS